MHLTAMFDGSFSSSAPRLLNNLSGSVRKSYSLNVSKEMSKNNYI